MSLYDRHADEWWNPDSFLYGLRTLLNPVRVPYIRAALKGHLPHAPLVLDLGCGGGLLSEELGRSARVVGVDPSVASIQAATSHLAKAPHAIHYLVGRGESIPLADESCDAVVCSEVLEHVPRPELVIAESARVLRPGGLLLYSGPNRTWFSRLVLIRLAQDWLRLVPPDLHTWEDFLTAGEMHLLMEKHGIESVDHTGVGLPAREAPAGLRAIVGLSRAKLSFGEAGASVHLEAARGGQLAYLGYGRKPA